MYLAHDQSLNRMVAVKVLISGQFASATARQRFRMEAEAAAGLRHPHIVEIHSFGDHSGRPYIVMEHVAGRSLNEHLDGTPLAPRFAARLVGSLADAVQHAHQAGIVHRDLKPANILISDFGSQIADSRTQTEIGAPARAGQPQSEIVKIADFGLAKRLDSDGPTATSQVLGTPSYMAPEQAVGAKNSGPAVDIYALGAILYECLTGRPPFKAATPLETLAQIADREPATPRTVNAAIPRPGNDLPEMSGQGPCRPLRERRRAGGGSRAIARRPTSVGSADRRVRPLLALGQTPARTRRHGCVAGDPGPHGSGCDDSALLAGGAARRRVWRCVAKRSSACPDWPWPSHAIWTPLRLPTSIGFVPMNMLDWRRQGSIRRARALHLRRAYFMGGV